MDQAANQSDADLLGAWSGGDESAFDTLVRRHGPLVRAACRRQLPDDAVDDAAQAVFLVLARRPAQAARAPAIEAWLLRTAWLVSRQMRRNHAIRKRLEKDAMELAASGAPQGFTDPDGILPEIDGAMQRLPPRQRTAITLQYIAGHSQAEIAARLGLQTNAVKQLVHRGLNGLRSQLRGRQVATAGIVAALAAMQAAAASEAGWSMQAGAGSATATATASAVIAASRWWWQPVAASVAVVAAAGLALVLWLPGRSISAIEPTPAPAAISVQANPPIPAAAVPVRPRPIALDELQRLIASGPVVLFDCSGTISYRAAHIPGAIDVEAHQRRFPLLLPKDRSTPVVVYGSGPTCAISAAVAEAAVQLRCTQVRTFMEGTHGWVAGGGIAE